MFPGDSILKKHFVFLVLVFQVVSCGFWNFLSYQWNIYSVSISGGYIIMSVTDFSSVMSESLNHLPIYDRNKLLFARVLKGRDLVEQVSPNVCKWTRMIRIFLLRFAHEHRFVRKTKQQNCMFPSELSFFFVITKITKLAKCTCVTSYIV